MTIDIYLAYVVTCAIICVIPGPTIILVLSKAIAHGRKSVIPLIIGVVAGDITSITFSLMGLGAIMAASAALFSIFKWIGATYLIYLAIKMWLAKPSETKPANEKSILSKNDFFKNAYIVTALNPKSIAFFVAFLPQFVQADAPKLPQFVLLAATFVIVATVNVTLYAVFAGELREKLMKSSVQKWFHALGGTALFGAGVLTAAMERK